MKQKEKVLTETVVLKLGLDKVDVITSEMLKGYTSIGTGAFRKCIYLTSITLPNSVTKIGEHSFFGCHSLTTINIILSIAKY